MAKVIQKGRRRRRSTGQYMVEFGMTFVFFIFVILAVINMILLAYNFNLGQRAAWEAARRAAVGGTNSEVAYIVYDQYFTKYFASPFIQSKMEFDSSTFILPNDIKDRVDAEEITLNLSMRVGFSIYEGHISTTLPLTTKLICIAKNDADRDGLYDLDVSRDANSSDHDNDGTEDEDDLDDDGDARPDTGDYGSIKWNGAAYQLRTYNGGAWSAWGASSDARFTAGKFHAPMMYWCSDGSMMAGPAPYRPQQIPRPWPASPYSTNVENYIDLTYDADNDGWEDKYD